MGPVPTIGIVSDASCIAKVGVKKEFGYYHGKVEWQAVDLTTMETVVKSGVQLFSTVNIGEFLGIVAALKFLYSRGDDTTPVYSDSWNAINWVHDRVYRTALPELVQTQSTHEDLVLAKEWLDECRPKNPVLKWHTWAWGEIPADYGRK